MPNRSTHRVVGAVAGFAIAAYCARQAPTREAIVEMIGGALFGAVGGVLPDIVEPATTPNHRKFYHSIAIGGGLTVARVADIQATCRRFADTARSRAMLHSMGCPERRKAELEAMFWRFLGGAAVGFVAGYVSHLVLDGTTRRGLPLLGVT